MASSIFYSQNLAADQYINWGITSGSNGYGIRDNAGTIEFKDTGGSWAPISSSSSGGGWQRVGTVVSLVTGTDTIGSNLRPTDETYTLGDSTHRWLQAFSEKVTLKTGAGASTDIYTLADDTFEIDTGGGNYLIGNPAAGGWEADLLTIDTGLAAGGGTFLSTHAFSVVGNSKFYNAPATSAAETDLITIDTEYISTSGAATDLTVPLRVVSTMGTNIEAIKGSLQNFQSSVNIMGSGSDSNEYSLFAGGLAASIGTGYTQTIGPVGHMWLWDLGEFSAINIQPTLFGGGTSLMNNYYNGSPTLAASYVYAAVTYPGLGAGIDATHAAATSYAVDDGFIVVGRSGTIGSPIGVGFTTAFRAGGAGSNWQVPTSKIGTAFKGQDIVTYGLDLSATEAADLVLRLAADEGDDATDVWLLKVLATGNAMTWTNAAALAMTLTTAGVLTPVTVQPSTSYKAVDGSTGATGTATAANTLTVKNGLITNIA